MKNIKRILSIILASSLIFSLSACGSSNNVAIATGGTSGTYYGFTGVVAQVLNNKLGGKINFTVESTGASKANVQLVDSGDCKIALLQNDVMYYAYTATDMFEGSNPVTSFSSIAGVYPETIQIVAQKGITSVDQLRGKVVSVGDAGSGVEFNARQVLEAYGMDIDKDIKKNNQSFADSADSLKNGTIDAAFVVAGHPTVAITELASNYDFEILNIDDMHLAALQSKYSFYSKATIPNGTYSKINGARQTAAVVATFIAGNNVSEDTVYEFTKGLFEYKNEFQHAKAEQIDINYAYQTAKSINIHPGALKYYKEKGLVN